MANLRLERDLLSQGHGRIAGVDEVGRGALFGPVVAAAVVLPSEWFGKRLPAWTGEINDSKLMGEGPRARLAGLILREAAAVGIGSASNAEIDDVNIFRASQRAMIRAVEKILPAPDILLVDGLPLKEVEYNQMGIPQGDRRSLTIASASIVAKVFRDDLMRIFDGVYGGYGLARHKGYATREHFRRLKDRGPTCLHRMSFKLRVQEPGMT